jgi:hypothetical protein
MAQTIAERVTARPAGTVQRGAGLQRFVAGWAALGVTLSGATQLRVPGLPVGPSELMLMAWIMFVAFLLLQGVRFTAGRAFFGLAGYWLVSLFLLALGALVAIHTHKVSSFAGRDAVALVYISVLVLLLALGLRDQGPGDYHLRMARMVFAFTAGFAALLIGTAAVTETLGPVRFWFGGIRFNGWAKNPNQMALAMVAMPFLGWWVLRQTPSRFGKTACALGIAVCMFVGIATQSDALRVAWAASFGAIGILLFYRVTLRGRSRWLHISHFLIPALVAVVGVFYGGAVMEHLFQVAEGVYVDRGQGDIRLSAWQHGIEVIGLSPLVGFGPGAYSGLYDTFEDFEAHNSLIDWGMSTGLTGVMLHLALWGWCLWRALRLNSVAFMGMAVAIMAFVMFGYLFRHPTYWIILVLILTLGEGRVGMGAAEVAIAPSLRGGGYRLSAAQRLPELSKAEHQAPRGQ